MWMWWWQVNSIRTWMPKLWLFTCLCDTLMLPGTTDCTFTLHENQVHAQSGLQQHLLKWNKIPKKQERLSKWVNERERERDPTSCCICWKILASSANSLCVGLPLQPVVSVDTQVFVVLKPHQQPLPEYTQSGCEAVLSLFKSITPSLVLSTFSRRWFLPTHSTKTGAPHSHSCPSLIHPLQSHQKNVCRWHDSCTDILWGVRWKQKGESQHHVRRDTAQTDKLRPVCEVVSNPGDYGGGDTYCLRFLPSIGGWMVLNALERTPCSRYMTNSSTTRWGR